MAMSDFWSHIINGPNNRDTGWGGKWAENNIGDTLTSGNADKWADFFRNVGWGTGAGRTQMYQSASPFAIDYYTKNAARDLPAYFYANAFATGPNSSAWQAPGGDAFGTEALKAFMPQWAQGQSPDAAANIAARRNQFNQAIANMETAWTRQGNAEDLFGTASDSWKAIQDNVDTAKAGYNDGVVKGTDNKYTVSSDAAAYAPMLDALVAAGLMTKHVVGKNAANADVFNYDVPTGLWNVNKFIVNNVPTATAHTLRGIAEQYMDVKGNALDWFVPPTGTTFNPTLANAAITGITTGYYNSFDQKAGAIASDIQGGGDTAKANQEIFLRMMMNALGQGYGGAFHNSYERNILQQIQDYSNRYTSSSDNFFAWLRNLYNGYMGT